MMPKISCYLPEATLEKIKLLQEKNENYTSHPLSQILRRLIENGLSNALEKESELTDAIAEIDRKLTVHSLKNTTLCAEILSCVFDENKINNNKLIIKERVTGIKQRVEDHMEKLQAESVD